LHLIADNEYTPDHPLLKTKTPPSTKKRVSKNTGSSDDEEHSAGGSPATKKRKVSSHGAIKVKLITSAKKPKKGKTSKVTSSSKPGSSKTNTVKKLDIEMPSPMEDLSECDESDLEDHFVEYKEPEDENLPEDERILRRLIKSSIWESEDDDKALEIVMRGMRLQFTEEKIANWEPNELLESIEYERNRSKEKVRECGLLKLDMENLDMDELISSQKVNASKKASTDDESEEDDDDQDDEKVKFY